VIRGISDLYKKDPALMNLSRVLDITQEIRDTLLPILNYSHHNFSVHLGVLAGKREFLHFEEWVQERMQTAGSPFVNELLTYLEKNVLGPLESA
jgi:CCR4-NOT transcription complex subunit 1